MPIDIKMLRPDQGGNPDLVRESQRKRFARVELVDETMACDADFRRLRGELDDAGKAFNAANKKVGAKKKASKGKDPCTEEIAEVARIKAEKDELTIKLKAAEAGRDRLLAQIGNIVYHDVPVFKEEEGERDKVMSWGMPKADKETVAQKQEDGTVQDVEWRRLHHHEVLQRIDGYAPERGVAVAGHRAYFLKGPGVLLNQALIAYGTSWLTKNGCTMLQPPFFMNKDMMSKVAQLEQYDEELYKVLGEKNKETGQREEKYLIATSEQPICAFHQKEWLNEKALPKRYGGISTCFRMEAGSHGRDTWGIFRVHQFEKVEQFTLTAPDKSWAMHLEMLEQSRKFYESLELPYRVVNIASGELNNAAAKKLDLEAWFPARQEYKELVSCSNCTDYQSRGTETRFGIKKGSSREKAYVHMLNSTLCATTRTICCILENYQTPTGVRVPDVLVPFMGGIDFLEFTQPLKENINRKKTAKGGKKKRQQQKKKGQAKAGGGGGGKAKQAPAKPPAAAAK